MYITIMQFPCFPPPAKKLLKVVNSCHCCYCCYVWLHFFGRLVGEVNEIHSSMDALTEQLNQANNSLKDLQDNRMGLEKEISIKKNSLFIDRDKCMTVRTRYPTTLKLQGYQ